MRDGHPQNQQHRGTNPNIKGAYKTFRALRVTVMVIETCVRIKLRKKLPRGKASLERFP